MKAIKKIKRVPTQTLTKQRIRLRGTLLLVLDKKIDSQIPPLTKDNEMIPERTRWQKTIKILLKEEQNKHQRHKTKTKAITEKEAREEYFLAISKGYKVEKWYCETCKKVIGCIYKRKHSQRVLNLSELTKTDEEGKEQEYIPEELIPSLEDERKDLNDSVPDESPYHLNFPWIEMREAIYWRLNDQERRLFECLYFDDLSYKQIARRVGLSVRQIKNREQKLAKRAFGPHLYSLMCKKKGVKKAAKLLAQILSGRGLKP